MSDNPSTAAGSSQVRVLSLRLDEDTRAQLEVLAQIQERSLTEECRIGLEHWVDTSKNDPVVQTRAEQVRADIERDAETRRSSIAAVLGTTTAASKRNTKPQGS